MRLFINSLTVLILIWDFGYAQNTIISGTVIDENQKPISYVNIGIFNQNIGTVTDEDGFFELNVSHEKLEEDLVFSKIGFQSKKISIQTLIGKSPEIELAKRTYELDVVDISGKRVKKKKLGDKRRGLLNVTAYIEDDNLGFELAHLFKNKNEMTKVENFSFYIRKNPFDSVKFRINIYEDIDGRPSENVLKENIIISFNEDEGWIDVNLNDYNIFVKGDYFVGVEWIEDRSHSANRKLYLAGKLFGSKDSWKRPTSQGKWEKATKVDVVMNSTISF